MVYGLESITNIFGSTSEQGISRLKTNAELYELFKDSYCHWHKTQKVRVVGAHNKNGE